MSYAKCWLTASADRYVPIPLPHAAWGPYHTSYHISYLTWLASKPRPSLLLQGWWWMTANCCPGLLNPAARQVYFICKAGSESDYNLWEYCCRVSSSIAGDADNWTPHTSSCPSDPAFKDRAFTIFNSAGIGDTSVSIVHRGNVSILNCIAVIPWIVALIAFLLDGWVNGKNCCFPS